MYRCDQRCFHELVPAASSVAAFDQSTNSNNEAVLKNLSATALDWA